MRELTSYDRVESIDLVEMDPLVIEACRAYLPGNACRMDDSSVHLYYENALKFIRSCENKYDLIIVIPPTRSAHRRDCLPVNFTAAASTPARGRHHGQPAGKSVLRRGRHRHAAQSTSALPVPFRSAVFTRRISQPLLPATGCLALPAKNIIL